MKRNDWLTSACLGLMACGLAACDGSNGAMPRPPEAAPTVERPVSEGAQVAKSTGTDPSMLDALERKRPLVAMTTCNLERLNGKAFAAEPGKVPAGAGQFRLSGWIADAKRGAVPPTVEIRLQSATSAAIWKVSADVAGKRKDVQALLGGGPEFERTGFSADINAGGMEPGAYRAYLVFADGEELKVCDNGRRIEL